MIRFVSGPLLPWCHHQVSCQPTWIMTLQKPPIHPESYYASMASHLKRWTWKYEIGDLISCQLSTEYPNGDVSKSGHVRYVLKSLLLK